MKPKGGLPGVDWGTLFELKRVKDGRGAEVEFHDLEMCFFLTHDKTGCTCVCYRSLEKKMIAISFRGTCQPVDLITDASLVQETWVEGEDIDAKHVRKVHKGFRYVRFDLSNAKALIHPSHLFLIEQDHLLILYQGS